MDTSTQANQTEPTLSPPPAPPQQQQPVAPQQDAKQKTFQKKKIIYRIYQIIWTILAFIETLLAFRMVLKAVGADPRSGFVTLVNDISEPFASPFNGIIKSTVTSVSTFDWSILVAAAVYALLAVALVQLIRLFLKPVSKEEVEQTVGEG